MSDLINELSELVSKFREEAKRPGPGDYYRGHETAYEAAAEELEKLVLQHIRETSVETSVKWQCSACHHRLTGNPRSCPWCGYTVYRAIFPEKVS